MNTTAETTADQSLLAYVTCPDHTIAQDIAQALVATRAAACVSIVPRLQSVYRWQGQIETANEALLMIKTRHGRLDAIRKCLAQRHPDELPELIAVDISNGSPAYLDWVLQETR